MNTAHLIASINKHVSLTEEESAYILSLMLPFKVRQHDMLEEPGQPTKYFMYVVSGCLMSYYSDKDDVDHVMQFAQAGWWTGDLTSYTKDIPSIMSTRALTDSEVLLLPRANMDQLLERLPKLERYFRILFQNSMINQGNRIIQNLSSTAEERYLAFQKKYPPL